MWNMTLGRAGRSQVVVKLSTVPNFRTCDQTIISKQQTQGGWLKQEISAGALQSILPPRGYGTYVGTYVMTAQQRWRYVATSGRLRVLRSNQKNSKEGLAIHSTHSYLCGLQDRHRSGRFPKISRYLDKQAGRRRQTIFDWIGRSVGIFSMSRSQGGIHNFILTINHQFALWNIAHWKYQAISTLPLLLAWVPIFLAQVVFKARVTRL